MISYDGELYIHGGLPAKQFSAGEIGTDRSDQDSHFMVKLSKVTNLWEPVSTQGALRGNWQRRNELASGAFAETWWSLRAFTRIVFFLASFYSLW